MKKDELTEQLARSTGVTQAEAADQLDKVVHGILKKLRQGKPANVPGLGKITPEARQKITFPLLRKPTRRGRR